MNKAILRSLQAGMRSALWLAASLGLAGNAFGDESVQNHISQKQVFEQPAPLSPRVSKPKTTKPKTTKPKTTKPKTTKPKTPKPKTARLQSSTAQAGSKPSTKIDGRTADNLKKLIERAQAQGLIEIKKGNQTRPRRSQRPAYLPQAKSGKPDMALAQSCAGTEIFSLLSATRTGTYEELMALKGEIGDLNNDSNRLTLAQNYLALGLGIEAAALAGNGKSLSKKLAKGAAQSLALVPIMARALEGIATDADLDQLALRLPCQEEADLWYLAGMVMRPSRLAVAPRLEVTDNMLTRARNMPPELARLFEIRLAQYAAETGDVIRAASILAENAPETQRGHLKPSRPFDVQYLYALTHYAKGDPLALEIIEREAQLDGVYKPRALRLLAGLYETQDQAPYEGFELDMRSITQFFPELQADSLFADVNIVRSVAQKGQMDEAIALTREKLPLGSPERQNAVDYIGENISRQMEVENIKPRIKALDTYVREEDFFEIYTQLDQLKAVGIDAAIELGIPELSVQIARAETIEGVELAQAQMALMRGDYKAVETLVKKHPNSKPFKAIALNAAIQSGEFERASNIISKIDDKAERLRRLSEFSWQRGQWQDAALSLENLGEYLPDDTVQAVGVQAAQDAQGTQDKGPAMNKSRIMARAELAQLIADQPVITPTSLPGNMNGLEQLTLTMSEDLDVIKGYLNNG